MSDIQRGKYKTVQLKRYAVIAADYHKVFIFSMGQFYRVLLLKA